MGLVSCIPVLFFCACEDFSEVGNSVLQNTSNADFQVREFSLPLSQRRLDFISTQDDPWLLFGQVEDSIFGRIEATAFTRFNYENESVPSNNISDSLFKYPQFAVLGEPYFWMKVNYFYHKGPEPITQEVVAYQLEDTLFDLDYRADKKLEVDTSIEVGRATFSFQKDSIDGFIKIPIQRLATKGGIDTLLSSFLVHSLLPSQIDLDYFFKGFSFQSDGESILGFATDESQLLVPYQIFLPGSIRQDILVDTLRFGFNSSPHFNNITVDRSTSKVEQALNSDNPTAVYYQPGTGIYPSFELAEYEAFVDSVYSLGSNISFNINLAQIEFGALNLILDTTYSRPNLGTSRFVVFDKNDSLGRTIDGGILTDNGVVLELSNPVDPSNDFAFLAENNNVYKANTTLFFQKWNLDVLNSVNRDFGTQFVIHPLSNSFTLDREIFPSDQAKLKVYYTIQGSNSQ